MGSSPWALCSIGGTSVEGLILSTIAQEDHEPTGDRAGGNKNEQRTGKTKGAGAVWAEEKKAEERHAKSLHIPKGSLQREGE